MLPWNGRLLAVGLLLAFTTLPATAKRASPQARRIEHLISQLGSPQFPERAEASRALAALGEAAVPALQRAATTSRDAEVRRRCRMLIARVKAIPTRLRESEQFAQSLLAVLEKVEKNSVIGVKRGEMARWAVAALFDTTPIPADLARRLAKATDLNHADLERLLKDAHARRAETRLVPAEAAVELVVPRVLARLDPYFYWAPRSSFALECYEKWEGLGLRLQTNFAVNGVQVLTPVYDSPAYQAGIRAGDVITHVTQFVEKDGSPLDPPRVVATAGLTGEQVGKEILGRSGTAIGLTVLPHGGGKPWQAKLKRRGVDLETVLGWKRRPNDRWEHWLDPDKKIAYVRITGFGYRTDERLARVLGRLRGAGMRGLVLDLRGNPGGLLSASVNTANLFIDRGEIVTVRPREGEEDRYDARPKQALPPFPMVCLIDGDTARTSEIVAGCLQDHKRAVIAGARSCGNGGVRNQVRVDEHMMILTVAVFVRPSGRKIDRMRLPKHAADEWGVTPDRGYAVPLTARQRDDLKIYFEKQLIIRRVGSFSDPTAGFTDRQRDRALAYLRTRLGQTHATP